MMTLISVWLYRSSRPEVFLRKGVLKICSKFTGEHPCRSAISIKLLCNFIEIVPRHGCSPVNFLDISRRPFPRNTFGRLLLIVVLKLGHYWNYLQIFILNHRWDKRNSKGTCDRRPNNMATKIKRNLKLRSFTGNTFI